MLLHHPFFTMGWGESGEKLVEKTSGYSWAEHLALNCRQGEQTNNKGEKRKEVPGSLGVPVPEGLLLHSKVVCQFRRMAPWWDSEFITKEGGNFNQGMRIRWELDYHNLWEMFPKSLFFLIRCIINKLEIDSIEFLYYCHKYMITFM